MSKESGKTAESSNVKKLGKVMKPGSSKEKILAAAKKEFLKYGYQDASMRRIASQVGITATALYRHFRDKESIFDAVVRPAIDGFHRLCENERNIQFTEMTENGADAMWERDKTSHSGIIDLIYDNFDEFKLIICKSAGTKYENFVHDFVTQMQQDTFYFMQVEEDHGISVNEVDEREIHLLMSAQCEAMFEVVRHDFTREEAMHFLETSEKFFSPGWRIVLGF